jgi:biotin transport system substrate-specific component
MTAATATLPTLADRLWPATERAWLRVALLVLLGSLLLTASAKVQVPMYPVPMTMQSFVVLVIGMAYGWRLAAGTVAFYLLQGAAGLPVFAGTPERGIGLPYMLGPTGGFLLGFLVAAMAMGWLAERGWDRDILKAIAALALGTVLLFVPGVAWLALSAGIDNAIKFGLTPFLWGSVIKLGLAAALLPLAWRAVETRNA